MEGVKEGEELKVNEAKLSPFNCHVFKFSPFVAPSQ